MSLSSVPSALPEAPSASPAPSAPVVLALAGPVDREAVYRLRHAVYADEIGQYAARPEGLLTDALDAVNAYVVARAGDTVVGFISVTPPSPAGYSVDKYVDRAALPVPFDGGLYELRIATVRPERRGSPLALALMYAGFRLVCARGGSRVMVMGRLGVSDRIYERLGLERTGCVFEAGATAYEVMAATTETVRQAVAARPGHLARVERFVGWDLPFPLRETKTCYHGGASVLAGGDEFADLGRTREAISADVLDAWFPPAPGVTAALTDHLPYLVQTSPPADAAGLRRAVARARGVPYAAVAPGAGSSDLIFRALQAWLTPRSHVLLLDPTYGEYAHVAEHVVGCRVDRLPLQRERGYALDLDALTRRLRAGYDLVVLVNPNSPTGRHVPRADLVAVLDALPAETRVWVDETYVDYVGAGESLEAYAAASQQVVVCKSMSKVYALSGLRVGYLCGPPPLMEAIRRRTPPWNVGYPAQVAAVRALADPAYYHARYVETHALRARLADALRALDGVEAVTEGVANFVLLHLAPNAPEAETVVRRARREGLYLRSLRQMTPESSPRLVRVAVKDAAANERIAAIFGRALAL